MASGPLSAAVARAGLVSEVNNGYPVVVDGGLAAAESAARTAAAARVRGGVVPSVLFTPQESASIDVLTVYELGVNGMKELSLSEPRFDGFMRTLFDKRSVDSYRELLGAEEEAQLKSQVAGLLRLLSPHFLEPAAQKVLEYLVRRYRVHNYDTLELVDCAIPFHGTVEFVRVIQLGGLAGTPYAFLERAAAEGAPVPRSVLANRCASDLALLTRIAEVAKAGSGRKYFNRPGIALFVTVSLDTLALTPIISEATLGAVLPYVLKGIASEGVDMDYTAGMLMLMGQLLSRTRMNIATVVRLRDALLSCKHSQLAPAVLRLLFHLLSSYRNYGIEIDESKAVKLLEQPGTTAALKDIVKIAGEKTSTVLIAPLLLAFVNRIGGSDVGEGKVASILREVDCGPIADDVAAAVIAKFNDMGLEEKESSEELGCLLRILDQQYPSALNKALNASLKNVGDDTVSHVQNYLRGSLRFPIDSMMTMAAGLESSEASIRESALNQLDVIYGKGVEAGAFPGVKEILRGRMEDEDDSVAAAAMSLVSLDKVLDTNTIVNAARHIVLFENASGKKRSKSLIKCTVKRLLKEVASMDSGPQLDIANSCILEMLLVLPQSRKASRSTFKQAVGFESSSIISSIMSNLEELKQKKSSKKEEHEGLKDYKANCNIIHAVSKVLCGHEDGRRHLLELAKLVGSRGRLLICLAILRALEGGFVDHQNKVSLAVAALGIIEFHWLNFSSADESTIEEEIQSLLGDGVGTWEDGLPPESWFRQLSSSESLKVQYGKLLRRVLLLIPSFLPLDTPNEVEKFRSLFVSLLSLKPENLFSLHIEMLLPRISETASRSKFLKDFISGQALSGLSMAEFKVSQIRSLELLEGWYQHNPEICAAELPEATSSLLQAMGSNSKGARKRACSCALAAINGCRGMASSRKKKMAKAAQEAEALVQALEIIVSERTSIMAESSFVIQIVSNMLGGNVKLGTSQSNLDAMAATLIEELRSPHAHSNGKCIEMISSHQNRSEVVEVLDVLLDSVVDAAIADNMSDARVSDARSIMRIYAHEVSLGKKDALSTQCIIKVLSILEEPLRTSVSGVATLCIEALNSITNEVQVGLGDDQKVALLETLLRLSTRCFEPACQGLAGGLVQRLAFGPSTFSAVLMKACYPNQPGANRSTKKTKRSSPLDESISSPPSPEALDMIRGTLEALTPRLGSWEDASELAQPICSVVVLLLNQTESLKRQSRGDGSDLEDTEEEVELGDGSEMMISIGYIIQLALSILEVLAGQFSCDDISVELVVRCVSEAPDSISKGTALRLLAILAREVPKKALRHVLGVVEQIGRAQGVDNDEVFAQATLQALSIITVAWMANGKSPEILLTSIVSVVPLMPPHRRSSVLLTILKQLNATKKLDGLALLLSILMAHGEDDSRASTGDETWISEVAEALCAQCSVVQVLSAIWLITKNVKHENKPMLSKNRLVGIALSQLQQSRVAREVFELFRGKGAEMAVALEAIEGIIYSTLEQVQKTYKSNSSLLKHQSEHDKTITLRQQRALIRSLCDLGTAAGQLLPSTVYLNILIDVINHGDELVSRRVRNLIIMHLDQVVASKAPKGEREFDVAKFMQQQTSAEDVRGMCSSFCKQTIVALKQTWESASQSKSATSALLALLDSLRVMVIYFAKGSSADFIGVLKFMQPLLEDGRSEVAIGALACLRSSITQLGVTLLPEYPVIVSPAIQVARDIATLKTADARHCSAIKFVSATLTALGKYMAPGDLDNVVIIILKGSKGKPSSELHSLMKLLPAEAVKSIPARLLLPKIVGLYRADGVESEIVGIITVANLFAEEWPKEDIKQHRPELLDFCRKVLSRRSDGFDGEEVEDAALVMLLSIVMKLSESAFKPFFGQFYQWACDSGVHGAARPARMLTLVKTINAISSQLRSIFLPYFGQALETLLSLLSIEDTSGLEQTPQTKRRKKGAKVVDQTSDLREAALAWRCKLATLQSLSDACKYDDGSFVTSQVFEAILPALLALLEYEPKPEAVAAAEESLCSNSISSIAKFEEVLSSSLVNLAVASGGDEYWKPLNHGVLMASRHASARVRMASIGIIGSLMDSLKEEYLVLLPETLPFLAELLEDTEESVAQKCEALIRKLEQMSGEDLSEYLS